MEKPKNPMDYIRWWNANFDAQIDLKARRRYDDVSTLVQYTFEHSDKFTEFIHQLHNYEAEYRFASGYDLLMKQPEDIKLIKKEWMPFVSKVWRRNVVQNKNWDEDNWNEADCKPDGGWIGPQDWFEEIHDIVRTRIVVKYFDAVRLLVDKMYDYFESNGCTCEPDWQAREEGYYAGHLNVVQDYEIPVALKTEKKRVSIEIQVTTQIKDIVNTLTHKYYERRRETLVAADTKWQWDYKSDEFSPNYIGHILHYVEGVIMQIRNREQENARS